MSCDHVGGPELIEMAERHLRAGGKGTQFRYTQNLDDSMWASVCVEIERRGNQWIVTRLDRSKVTAPELDTGFKVLNE